MKRRKVCSLKKLIPMRDSEGYSWVTFTMTLSVLLLNMYWIFRYQFWILYLIGHYIDIFNITQCSAAAFVENQTRRNIFYHRKTEQYYTMILLVFCLKENYVMHWNVCRYKILVAHISVLVYYYSLSHKTC